MKEFTVFLSFKNTDANGAYTKESAMAKELYEELMRRGIHTFFSNVTLEIMGAAHYKKNIDDALDECQVLIVIGTSPENVTSKWVEYEWDSFYNDILSGIKKDCSVFSYIDGMSPQALPRTLRHLQVFEKTKNSLGDICTYIENSLRQHPKTPIAPGGEIPALAAAPPPATAQPTPTLPLVAAMPAPTAGSESAFVVVEGKEITVQDIEEALLLDKMVYDEEYYVTLDRCLEWFKRNNEIYSMLKDKATGKIVAYINVSPVSDEYYELIKSGAFIDTYLPPQAIIAYDMPSLYNIYFSSVVLHPEYQNTGAFKPLFDAVVNKFIRLGESDIFMKRMVADAVTEKGEKFCLLFGMKKISNSQHNSTIYEVNLMPPQFRVSSKSTSLLYKYYTEKAQELDFLLDM